MRHTPKITPVILAGGSGTRLWPVSRTSMPKQFCKISGEKSLFQNTLERVADEALFNAPIIVSGATHQGTIEIQLEEVGIKARAIICEPFGRDTAAAIAMTVNIFDGADEDVMLVLPSDHHISDAGVFSKLVERASYAAIDGTSIITFGIKPTHPDTGFGYIRAGQKRGSTDVFDLEIFIEKPELQLAEELIQDNDIFWNAGIFMFHPSIVKREFQQHSSQVFLQTQISVCHGEWRGNVFHPDAWIFDGIEPISFDYAVMEKTQHAAIAKADIEWSDMGSWGAIWDNRTKCESNNAVSGETYVEDVKNSLVISDGPAVAVSGLEDVVVIAQDDVVLVTSRQNTQDVKKLVAKVQSENKQLVEENASTTNVWGEEKVLLNLPDYQMKMLSVNPHVTISNDGEVEGYKTWFITAGNPFLELNGRLTRLAPNQKIELKPGDKFELRNIEDEQVEIMEVWLKDCVQNSSFEYPPQVFADLLPKSLKYAV